MGLPLFLPTFFFSDILQSIHMTIYAANGWVKQTDLQVLLYILHSHGSMP